MAADYTIRTHRPGDIGWIIHRHGMLYWEEYRWDERFEAAVAQVCADFVKNLQPERERLWIAERDGQFLGCIMLVQGSDPDTSKLRIFLVEPAARGLGLGNRLVRECIDFARECGYRKVMLWTNSCLLEARHLYEKHGFKIVSEEAHHSFGHDLVGETWELDLS